MPDKKADTVRITVNLVDNSFNLNVDQSQEREVRDAAKYVNERFNIFMSKKDFNQVKAMSMVALEMALEFLKIKNAKDSKILENKVVDLIGRIEEKLKD